jgi:general secretion pathway protein I
MTRNRGFSLIEIMATLVLIAIVLPVVMQGFSLSNNLASLARQRSEAATLAESKLSELAVTGLYQQGVLSGDFAPDRPDFKWTADLSAFDSSTLQVLTVHVIWTARGQQNEFRTSTLVDTAQ